MYESAVPRITLGRQVLHTPSPGLRERYREISKYLRQVNLPFMVDFQYLEQGIRVRGQWYPILKMQWVEGFLLNEFVRDNLDKKPILQSLGQFGLAWRGVARGEWPIAICSMANPVGARNIANSLAVKLIDYDGMCVPARAGTTPARSVIPPINIPNACGPGPIIRK